MNKRIQWNTIKVINKCTEFNIIFIDNEYISEKYLHTFKCECGNEFKRRWSDILKNKSYHCYECSGIIKYNLESLRYHLNTFGYELLSDKYKNTRTKLIYRDKDGYVYHSVLGNLLDGHIPSIFGKSNIYTIQNIKLWLKINNKNFELVSEEYKGNKSKLKFKCLKTSCGEIFESNWNSIYSQSSGCPYCIGQQSGLSNCLATKNPKLAKEWHPTKNGDLTPYNVTEGSNKNFWWTCHDGHEWKATVFTRADGRGCPFCSGRLPTEYNNLLIYNPQMCEEWNYDKNKNKPEEYTPHSSRKVWWKCKECNFEWETAISRRINGGTNCPECNKSSIEILISKYLKCNNIVFIPQMSFCDLIGVGGKQLSYDFYLPDYNLLIEYQGKQHEKYTSGFHLSEKDFERQQEHDNRKREYSKIHKIKLLEIWYWDSDNVEDILNDTLNK